MKVTREDILRWACRVSGSSADVVDVILERLIGEKALRRIIRPSDVFSLEELRGYNLLVVLNIGPASRIAELFV